MDTLTRRDFLESSARIAALFGLCGASAPAFAESLSRIVSGQVPLLWLQGQSCSGCSVSLLNSEPLTIDQVLTRHCSLQFHQTLSAATGHTAVETVNKTIAAGGYFLVVEGSVPAAMPRACMFGEEPFTQQLLRAARQAKAVVAVGTCATDGGVPAGEGNPTGAVSVTEFLKSNQVKVPVISLPGCPCHPDWIVGTLAHVARFGVPALDEAGRPKAYYGRLIHDQCPRFPDYEREIFAKAPGDSGCLFRIGCLGPVTFADCTHRGWNGGINHCIRAGAPCVGCASPGFARRADFPMHTLGARKEIKA
jgi:hydrogenase small subunit